MSLLKKMVTAIRGGANEVGEAIVDSQSLRILDQEIRDANEALRKSRTDLTNVMAQRKLAGDKLDAKQKKLDELEGYASMALEKGDESLAIEIAERIAELEGDVASEREVVENYDASIASLKKSIKQAENTLVRLKQQVDSVKATASVQRAQAAVASRHSGQDASLRTALDSLERIKGKQAERAAQMEAAETVAREENGDDLDAKLRAAGLKAENGSANAVLERLKKKREAGGAE
ncbi:phage shock protein A [Alkalilimnicola ehrlichii]|uniref:Phage shock protein A n=1 Tax=Alkalilimnicola ehrlichii TaxID=351052 RepID=A0A3E0WR40_9GAMM|nr:PspA/IM30 family protein [Alkalilimnicola ehrlichii]RFA24735.1 phage shock protein A [Alkalilimnicola ehrlichii]RFA35432.1 phage shock protein A [Alkalilimnicola ehrlichii]